MLLLQWPEPLNSEAGTKFQVPNRVELAYGQSQASSRMGALPELRMAWAAVDNRLFLWHYDRWVLSGCHLGLTVDACTGQPITCRAMPNCFLQRILCGKAVLAHQAAFVKLREVGFSLATC